MHSKEIVHNFFQIPIKVSKEMSGFVKQLKRKPPNNLDVMVHNLHHEAFRKIDCLDCANCCKSLGPGVKNIDIERLSKFLKRKPSDVVADFFRIDDDGDYVFKEMPCPFLLDDNYCLVYEARPKACREYPHTDRRRFAQLLVLSKRNMEVCPAVYDVMTELKISVQK